jgi:hypothetical protein
VDAITWVLILDVTKVEGVVVEVVKRFYILSSDKTTKLWLNSYFEGVSQWGRPLVIEEPIQTPTSVHRDPNIHAPISRHYTGVMAAACVFPGQYLGRSFHVCFAAQTQSFPPSSSPTFSLIRSFFQRSDRPNRVGSVLGRRLPSSLLSTNTMPHLPLL